MRCAAVLLFVAALSATTLAGEPPAAKRKPRYTISKETTFIEKPLLADGRPDYVAALNQRLGDGVTPDVNACVLLWQALGPSDIKWFKSAEYFRILGIEPPKPKGKYFVSRQDFEKANSKKDKDGTVELELYDQFNSAEERPWTFEQFPRLKPWIQNNEESLQLAIAASKRSGFFSPYFETDVKDYPGQIIGSAVSLVQGFRGVTCGLKARAMLRLGMGETRLAWEDLQATRRLARLAACNGSFSWYYNGCTCDNRAGYAEIVLLATAKLDAPTLKRFQNDLARLATFPAPAVAQWHNRIDLLHSLLMVETHDAPYLSALLGFAFKDRPRIDTVRDIDWNELLRCTNSWFDRSTAAVSLPDRPARMAAFKVLDDEMARLKTSINKDGDASETDPANNTARRERLQYVLLDMYWFLAKKTSEDHDRKTQFLDNVITAFAIARYQRETGAYPNELADILPIYLDRVPTDLFANAPIRYRKTEDGFVLWSVGVNGKDDGGQERDFDKAPEADDIVTRLPLPELKP